MENQVRGGNGEDTILAFVKTKNDYKNYIAVITLLVCYCYFAALVLSYFFA